MVTGDGVKIEYLVGERKEFAPETIVKTPPDESGEALSSFIYENLPKNAYAFRILRRGSKSTTYYLPE
jgi:hypothetical protein